MNYDPSFAPRCILEVHRRSRVSRAWTCLYDQYTRRLVEFQHIQSRRFETLSHALKDNLLADIFRPLHIHFRPLRQHSRLSLISSSSKRLSSRSKCLSTSQINLQTPTSTAFRLPSNRSVFGGPVAAPAEVRLCALPSTEAIERSGEPPLPSISESEIRKLASQLPSDLSKVVVSVLAEIDSEAGQIDLISECLLDDYEEGCLSTKSQNRCLIQRKLGRFRLSSSPGALGTLHQTSVDAATATEDRLACIAEQ